MSPALAPGAWIGIVGGGQLGRMLTIEARRMGYRVCVLDPAPLCPAGQVADRIIAAPYDDPEAAEQFVQHVAAFTYEFENVDASTIERMGDRRPVYPSAGILRMKQNRLREKETLAAHGFPVADWRAVTDHDQLQSAVAQLGFPIVLKTATEGYDGKGQWKLSAMDDVRAVNDELQRVGTGFSKGLVAEKHVQFSKELSVICARSADGEAACYPVVENVHRNGILDTTSAPAQVSPEIAGTAQRLAVDIAVALDVVGLLAVEMFLLEDGQLLVNELAPRPHNSGHYTMDACVTSQFEQLLRVLCGLPLGESRLLTPAVMVNVLGDLWGDSDGAPDLTAPFGVPGVKLHLYGKADARPGRKMGHLTALADSIELATQRALAARAAMCAEPTNVLKPH